MKARTLLVLDATACACLYVFLSTLELIPVRPKCHVPGMKVDVGDLTVSRSVDINSSQLGFFLEEEEEDFVVLELELELFLFLFELEPEPELELDFLDDVLEDDVAEGGTLVSFAVVLVRYGSNKARM